MISLIMGSYSLRSFTTQMDTDIDSQALEALIVRVSESKENT
ncbi:MAG: hypothetical protein ABJD02_00945 [Paraglaciecola sp.]